LKHNDICTKAYKATHSGDASSLSDLSDDEVAFDMNS